MYPHGIPDPDRAGFLMANAAVPDGSFEAAIPLVAARLGRPAREVDPEGYEWEITAASTDDENNRFAWVECRSKERGEYLDVCFHLNAHAVDTLIVRWEIETYNPYFGCQIEFMGWVGEHFILLYHEKHDTYACSFDLSDPGSELITRPFARFEIADEWLIRDNIVFYRSEVLDTVDRRQLPGLQLLEPWPAERARAENCLPPEFDRMNELLRSLRDPAAAAASGKKSTLFEALKAAYTRPRRRQ